MLDEPEQLSERDLHANRLIRSLQSERKRVAKKTFNRVLLYFVAALSMDAKADRSGNERNLLDPTRDVELVHQHMLTLLERCCADQAIRSTVSTLLNHRLFGRLLQQLEGLDTHVTARSGFIRRLFDILLRQTLANDYDISLDHAHIVASLAVSLSTWGSGIIEALPYSGASNVTAAAMEQPRDCVFWDQFGYPYVHQDLIRLRLTMRNMQQEHLSRTRFETDAQDYLTLIDGVQLFKDQGLTAMEILAELLRSQALSDITLVTLNQTHIRNLSDEQRHTLLQNNLLEAVIDLPSLDSSRSDTVFTTWVLNRHKAVNDHPDQVLFIDATHLADKAHFPSTWFAAAVLRSWRESLSVHSHGGFQQVMNSSLGELFIRYFENGYRNVHGVCKEISNAELVNVRDLTAENFLQHKSKNSAWRDLACREVMSVLQHSTGPACCYLIGDNGEGKSQLLSDLIGHIAKHQLDSIGIAFTLQDRFPLSPVPDLLFTYAGARCADEAQRCTARNTLNDCLLSIYDDDLRLLQFERILELLNFGSRHYFMPILDPDNPLETWERLAATISVYDALAGGMLAEYVYEPAILRKEKDEIVPFSDLSSGEKQLFALLLKVCANADQKTVLLIDEPELSLHVSWQQQLPKLFSSIAREYGCSMVIATHSPILIANARDSLSHCFLVKDKVLKPIEAFQRHSVDSILLDGFHTYAPDNYEISERCAVLVSRAIYVANQPGRLDKSQREVLQRDLDFLRRKLDASTPRVTNARFDQDQALVKQAEAAIDEVFKHAEREVQ